MRIVQYDFGAAQTLSDALAQLAGKLNDLIDLRDKQNASYLTTGNDQNAWKGPKHDDFLKSFSTQKAALTYWHEQAMTLKGQVDDATSEAHVEQTQMANA